MGSAHHRPFYQQSCTFTILLKRDYFRYYTSPFNSEEQGDEEQNEAGHPGFDVGDNGALMAFNADLGSAGRRSPPASRRPRCGRAVQPYTPSHDGISPLVDDRRLRRRRRRVGHGASMAATARCQPPRPLRGGRCRGLPPARRRRLARRVCLTRILGIAYISGVLKAHSAREPAQHPALERGLTPSPPTSLGALE